MNKLVQSFSLALAGWVFPGCAPKNPEPDLDLLSITLPKETPAQRQAMSECREIAGCVNKVEMSFRNAMGVSGESVPFLIERGECTAQGLQVDQQAEKLQKLATDAKALVVAVEARLAAIEDAKAKGEAK